MRRYLLNGFTILLLGFALIAGVYLFLVPKEEGHLAFNLLHNNALDLFFTYLTHLGDGLFVSVVIFIFLFVRFKSALILLLSFLTTAGVTQFLKKIVYHDSLRPVKFFEGKANLVLTDGVEMNYYHSFPSGHATSAFALFFCLALLTQNKLLQVILFFMALMVSFSRVYLSQHFVEDIYAGAVIGSSITLVLFHILNKIIPPHYNQPLHLLIRK